jgi:CRISPR-associated endonuclease/helicase Cas3
LVPRGVDDIYDHALLIRSAALVREALSSGGWVLPTDIRPLVTRGYSDDDSLVPDAWRADYANVRQQSIDGKEKRKYNARDFLLGTTNSMGKKSLEGLHAYSAENLPTDDAVSAVVRDGPETIEVVMVRRRGDDLYTLSGRRLVTGCVPVDDDDAAIQDACGSSVRLPPHPRLTAAARGLRPPAVFESDPDLGGLRVVELGEDGSAELGGETLRYDAELGLQSEYSRRSAR